MRHIKLVLQYDGTDYSGWQVQNVRRQGIEDRGQKRILTIQAIVEDAVFKVTSKRSRVTSASRTDAGVHAIKQVASFKTETGLDTNTLQRAVNVNLPPDIRILDVSEVDEDFHPRYSAKRKIYSYLITRSYSVFLRRYSWYIPYDLDCNLMRQAGGHLLGEHNFSSFRASGCGSKNPVRRIFDIKIEDVLSMDFMTIKINTPMIKISIEANAFLRHMARNIIGILVEVGRGKFSPSDVKKILELKDRRYSGPTAPANGLFLERIVY